MSTAQVTLNGSEHALLKTSGISRLRLRLTRLFTICLLIGLSLGASNWNGDHPFTASTLFAIGIAVASFGAAGRAWATSYISGLKLKQLVSTGPYSLCRNPLYFFNWLLGIGLGFCTETFTIPAIIAMIMFVLHHFQIKREELHLRRMFGAQYDAYVASIPRFFPSYRNYVEPETICISPQPLRKGLFGIAFLLMLIAVLEAFRGLHQSGLLPELFRIY